MDFDKIVLSKAEMELLERMKREEFVVLEKESSVLLKRLIRFNFAVEESFYEDFKPRVKTKITDLGEDYLMYVGSLQHQLNVATRRFRITTVIAAIALIKSFLPQIRMGLIWLLGYIENIGT